MGYQDLYNLYINSNIKSDLLIIACGFKPQGGRIMPISKLKILSIELKIKSLQQLSEQLPNYHQSQERLELWEQTNYSAWAEQLKITIINYRNINHQWQFSPEQQQVLQRYYDANQLLLDCLHSNCKVMAVIRQEIEATLLLPIKELEDREWQ